MINWRTWLLILVTVVGSFVAGVIWREIHELLAIDWGFVS